MVTPGRLREHAQRVSSLKIYFRSRLTAVASRILKSLLAENEAAARAVKTNKETEGSLLAHRRWETFRQEEHGLRLSDRNSILIT